MQFKSWQIISMVTILALATGCGTYKPAANNSTCSSIAANTYVAGSEVGLNNPDIGGINAGDLAQSFKTGNAKLKIDSVDIGLIKKGSPNPSAFITISIQNDSNGIPDNINLTSGSIQVAQISTTAVRAYHFAFGQIQLEPNRKYWIRLSTPLAINNTNFIQWVGNPNNSFPNGEAKYFTGSLWLNSTIGPFAGPDHDFNFALNCQ